MGRGGTGGEGPTGALCTGFTLVNIHFMNMEKNMLMFFFTSMLVDREKQ